MSVERYKYREHDPVPPHKYKELLLEEDAPLRGQCIPDNAVSDDHRIHLMTPYFDCPPYRWHEFVYGLRRGPPVYNGGAF